LRLDGFLCPGHVSAVIGTKAYEFIPKRYKIPCCVAGFEPLDIMEGLYFLVEQIARKKPGVSNQYNRVVTGSGNLTAQRILKKVFKVSSAYWRGFGVIDHTGLELQKQFSSFDASREFGLKNEASLSTRKSRCRCADILKGLIKPSDCPLFSKVCNPENPIGPCMVSSEGACNAYFKYK
jgi:hydrogenase expression/formation protein HypD